MGEPIEIFNNGMRQAGTVRSKIVDWRAGGQLVIKVESSLDQAVNVQLLGDISEGFSNPANVGAAVPCPANAVIRIGPAWDDWHPWIAINVIAGVAPLSGIVRASVVLQRS